MIAGDERSEASRVPPRPANTAPGLPPGKFDVSAGAIDRFCLQPVPEGDEARSGTLADRARSAAAFINRHTLLAMSAGTLTFPDTPTALLDDVAVLLELHGILVKSLPVELPGRTVPGLTFS